MPLGLESTDFLSHIDEEISPSDREAILTLVRTDHPSDYATTLHPNIPTAPEIKFSPLIEAEFERIANERPLEGIDKSRYEAEALEAPERTSPDTDENDPELLKQWRDTLQRAYATSTYLSGRTTNLSLLETYGKNAWLISNSQLEQILRDLETDLVDAKRQVEGVEEERRQAQEGAKAEMEGLDVSWRRGLRGIVEVEIATDGLRREVMDRRRSGIAG